VKIPHSVTGNKLLQAFIAVAWQLLVRHSLSMTQNTLYVKRIFHGWYCLSRWWIIQYSLLTA
jgi:hypothetical protein